MNKISILRRRFNNILNHHLERVRSHHLSVAERKIYRLKRELESKPSRTTEFVCLQQELNKAIYLIEIINELIAEESFIQKSRS